MAKSLMWHIPINKSLWPQEAGWLPLWGPKYFYSGSSSSSSVPHLHLMSWLFSLSGTPQRLHFPWATVENGFFCYHFFQWGWHLCLLWGKLLSELQCLSVSMAPFLCLREQQLSLTHWDTYCVSPPLIKPRIPPLVLLLTSRLNFCPGKFQ